MTARTVRTPLLPNWLARRNPGRAVIALFGLAWRVIEAWNKSYATSMGAALAYYTAFSLTPLVILVLALARLFFNGDSARAAIVGEVAQLIGSASAQALNALLGPASVPQHTVTAAVVGGIALLIGSTSVFAELQADLDRIWNVPAAVRPNGLWGLLRTRLLSFGLIVAMGFLLVVSLAMSALLSTIGSTYGTQFAPPLLQVINVLVGYGGVAIVFTVVYQFLPSVKIAWHDAIVGGLVTTSLFSIGKWLIGLYIGNSQAVTGYGAAGSLLVLLVWVYYSAQIFLFGAITTRMYSEFRLERTKTRKR